MCIEDLKRLMESLGAPQTHVALKGLMKEVDEDQDGAINLREVTYMSFRKLENGFISVSANLPQSGGRRIAAGQWPRRARPFGLNRRYEGGRHWRTRFLRSQGACASICCNLNKKQIYSDSSSDQALRL